MEWCSVSEKDIYIAAFTAQKVNLLCSPLGLLATVDQTGGSHGQDIKVKG